VKFFGILSHDLRSPIASLINFLHLLKNEPELLTAGEKAKHQQQIGQSAEELLQSMETMLLWSKEQMEHFKPDIRLVPVSALFDYLQKFFPETQRVSIRFNDPENLVVSADENYLKVIMQNLTSNAIKALKNTTEGRIEWKARKDGSKTILSITDNGPGINEEQVRSLYQEGSGFNARTGFGLHLIRDLAKAIQYHISIESKPGFGTTFVLSSGIR
jgi:signal transduction histidine kinase